MNQTTQTEKQFRVSLNGDERVLPQSQVMAYADELNAKHGSIPAITPMDTFEIKDGEETRTYAFPAPVVVQTNAVEILAPKQNSGFHVDLVVDDEAKTRIEGMHEQLRAAGVQGLDAKGGGKVGGQLYASGTRMADVGYANQAARAQEHAEKASLADVAAAFQARIAAEQRQDVVVHSGEIGRSLKVNGKVTVLDGLSLGAQAIRGLASRIESPMTRYIMGLRDRIAENVGAARQMERNAQNGGDPVDVPARDALLAAAQTDKREIARVIQYECARNPDVEVKMRTRRGLMDVFAMLSPTYGVADAPEVIAQVIDELPADAKGTYSYDPVTTRWELRAHVWTPVPVVEQAVGEPFEGYGSFKSADNGTHPLGGGGGIILLACLNAGTYTADGTVATRVHRSGILEDLDEVVAKAMASITVFATALGAARQAEVEVPSGLTIDDAIPGFWAHLLRGGRGKELAGILPGRRVERVAQLSAAYFDQRRDPEKVVRSDFAQAWTRAIQGEDASVRRAGEDAIGAWLVKPRKMVCEVEGQDEELASV
jgi:hypothetical protein